MSSLQINKINEFTTVSNQKSLCSFKKNHFSSAIMAALLTSVNLGLINGHAQAEGMLEEVTVTARKRAENLMEVPESLTAFSENMVEKANIDGLNDIGMQVPNLFMSTRMDGFPNVSIRGLGGFGNTQGVGFYLDDVQLFSDASARFGDLERLEVLKGPQGILYGGSNIGGAVKFVSKRPDTESFSGRVKVKAGENSYYDGEIQLNIPLNDEWAMRFFAYSETDDSFLKNPNSARASGVSGSNDADIGKRTRKGARITIAGDISEQLSVYGAVRYNDSDGANNTWSREISSDFTYSNNIDTSFNPRHDKETTAVNLEFNYDMENMTLTSITAYTDTDSVRETDLDISQEFILDLVRPEELKTFSQEIRLSSATDGPLEWQVGAYMLDLERDLASELIIYDGFCYLDPGTCAPAPGNAVLAVDPFEVSKRKREQYAAFANINYRWDSFELGFGVRFDDWSSERDNLASGLSGKKEGEEILTRLSAAWFIADGSMLYGTLSQGFEPGDVNLGNFSGANELITFENEEATQFEIGYKGSLLEEKMNLTIAAFFIDYKNRQFELQAEGPSGEFVEGIINVGDSEQWGIEADILLYINENWGLSFGVGYVDAEWKNGTTSTTNGADLSGQTPPNIADWSSSVALDYSNMLSNGGEIYGRVGAKYKAASSTNSQFFDVPGDTIPQFENPEFITVDLSLGYSTSAWSFDLSVENILDEEYYIDVQEFPNFAGSALAGPGEGIIIGSLEQPRRLVASISFNF
jgi:iron complex outermembrane receptor protein